VTAIFVTGTGTDIGKTFVAAGLVRQARSIGRDVEAVKPVMSGFDPGAAGESDAGLLLAALGEAPTEAAVARLSPWRFRAPLSPDMAAAAEGRAIDFAELVSFSRWAVAGRRDLLLIEGVGGVMVPLDPSRTVLDWMAALALPVILVAGSYLGTISHTLTALDVLTRRQLAVAAIVVSESAGSTVALPDTVQTIARFAGAVPILPLPRGDGDAQAAVFSRLLGLL
jgi:dethiobiotin synthetase